MLLPMVTAENYFSREMNMAYMGATQFKAFDRCEAAALAELRGEYVPAASTALLIGSYVDAYFSGELPVFQAQHPEIFKRDGSLKAEFVHAQDVIARMEADELYMLLLSGKKQVILTGEIAGVPFKVKIDSLLDAAPEEFLDEMTNELMKDPVMLPNSKMVLDRSTIERLLMEKPVDPYDRTPLTKEQLIPRELLLLG